MGSSFVRRSVALAAVAMGVAFSTAGAQRTGTLTGTVVDSASRQPILGAQVTIVGTTSGALTDAEGQYSIRNVRSGTAVVRVQRIGYGPASREVTIDADGTTTADFALGAVARILSEIVTIGYGTNTRANVSSAISSVSAADIENTPVASVDAALQGKAPGVQVVQNAGNPGVGITVRIRGSASISASNQPLYVIDGIPMLRDEYSQLGMGGQDISAVSGLNVDEIESIDVLKDAAAAAIYGSRGSNGVVMITTKRGKAGTPRINFNLYTGSQSVPSGERWELLSGREYIEFMNEAAENDGYGANFFGDPADVTVDTDWQDEIFRSAPISDLHLGLAGGSDRVRYYVSGSFFDQEGVVLGSDYNRAAGRVNVDFSATDQLSVRTSLAVSREEHGRIENDDTIEGVVTNAIANEPYVPARNPDGSFTSTDDGMSYVNPIALAEFNQAETRALRALGAVEANYNLTTSLTLNGRVGMDVLNARDLRWDSPRVVGTYAQSASGTATQGNATVNRYVVEGFATFERPMGALTSFALTGGGSVEWNGEEIDYLYGEGFSREEFQYVGNAAKIVNYDGDWTGHNLRSAFARVNGTILDRYLFTGNLRVDGSSRFGENKRYGTFPAVSVGWNVTEEPALADWARFGSFKLRASYGMTGNQDIFDDFAPLARFGRANYSDIPGIAQTSFANPDLRWETTREWDIGFDLSVLDGRVTVLGDVYNKKTEDLLLSRPITSTSGQTSILENVGNMENRGFELAINTINLSPGSVDGFRWTTDFNIAWNTNEVTKLFRNEPFNTGYYSAARIEVGQPLSAWHTLRFLGVDPETGDAIFDDINGDGDINADDRVIIGSPHPDYWGGLTNQLSWLGFDLKTFFQFSQGQTIFNAISVFADDGGYYYDNKFKRVLRRWQQPGDVTDIPRASFDGVSGADRISSRYFEDGSYVRLQEVTLGYRIPPRYLGAVNLREARVFVSGRNLKTWTDYSGYSPDVNSAGASSNTDLATEFYAYPLPRSITVGISGSW